MTIFQAPLIFSLLGAAISLFLIDAVVANNYGMYVWRDAFDAESPHCNGVYPSDKTGNNANCFRHSWETNAARQHLWSSCTVPGREVTRIFLSDVYWRIENEGKTSIGQCDEALLATLSEAHLHGIEVYGLYAVSDAAFSEKDLVNDLNQFNTNCGTNTAFFDGAAVNNEYFTLIKTCNDQISETEQLNLLSNLAMTRDNASPLPLHFSVSWNWDCCTCSEIGYVRRELTWNGNTKSALEHMIDIVDSVDVQVGWNVGSTMERRSSNPYNYWEVTKALGGAGGSSTSTTAFYILAYTNPNSDCRLSFSPHKKGSTTPTDTCTTGDRTETGMYTAFDEILVNQPRSRGGIHFMSGVYSTGMPGWPKHIDGGNLTPTSSPSPSVDCSKITNKKECNRVLSCSWSGTPKNGFCEGES